MKANIIKINNDNYNNLRNVLEKVKKDHISGLKVFLAGLEKEKIQNVINMLMKKYSQYFQIKLLDLPYCLISESYERLIENEDNPIKKKLDICKNCRYSNRCGGFPRKHAEIYTKDIKPIKDLPREVMIELEPNCNFDCTFCFNKNSFAEKGRDKVKSLKKSYVKKIIKAISLAGIKIIRFTGGEPMLRKDIWQLMDYAKKRGLEIRLNTNGSLIERKDVIMKLNRYVSSILIPFQSFDVNKESASTGYKNALKKKIRAVKLLKKYSKITVRGGTVATCEAIRDLGKIFDFVVNKLEIKNWELYRPIPLDRSSFYFNRDDFKVLVDKLINIKRKTGRVFQIVNSVPFCGYDKKKVNSVSSGALSIDGHIRYVIDPRGFAKPDYYINKNIGSPLNILSCWNHPFMKKMRNLGFAPKECKKCQYLKKCRGGSRFIAKKFYGSFYAKDPLTSSF